jgi:hypothetical protein
MAAHMWTWTPMWLLTTQHSPKRWHIGATAAWFPVRAKDAAHGKQYMTSGLSYLQAFAQLEISHRHTARLKSRHIADLTM